MSKEKAEVCVHTALIKKVKAKTKGCENCLKTGDEWVHLRQCRICGHIGCCNNSKNQHATKHFNETGHKIMQSFEPEEHWFWCYECDLGMEFFR